MTATAETASVVPSLGSYREYRTYTVAEANERHEDFLARGYRCVAAEQVTRTRFRFFYERLQPAGRVDRGIIFGFFPHHEEPDGHSLVTKVRPVEAT